MASFRFVGRYSISNVDLLVINDAGTPVYSDANPVVSFRNFATNTALWSRATVNIAGIGNYRVTLSSVETGNPGLYYLLWNYAVDGIPQQYRTDVEIPTSSSTLYDTLSAGYQAVVDYSWARFEDLFDSAVGGPHLQMYAQSNFGRERVAQLMRVALGGLNSTSQPHTSYTLEGDADFPFPEWGGILEQATTVEIIKHLMRSYVEQPAAESVTPARLDRRDYLSRWGEILDIETKEYERQLAVFKMAQMNLGRGSLLVSGGIYGHASAYNNPARRPRYMPGWVR